MFDKKKKEKIKEETLKVAATFNPNSMVGQ